MNQRWVLDIGLPGPDKARAASTCFARPGGPARSPEGLYAGTATTNRVLVLVRALPQGGDMAGAVELMKSVKVHP